MVGVPALVRMWLSGPSVRMGWPLPWRRLSQPMMLGPNRKHTRSEVSTAPPVRKVRYRNRLKTLIWSASG